MLKLLFAITLLLISPLIAAAGSEGYYKLKWCQEKKGQIEYRLADNTRCDCLTATHAVEVEFAHKWYEAVGQALYYGMMTDRKPGIVLIVQLPSDLKYWQRLNRMIDYHAILIDTWKTGDF